MTLISKLKQQTCGAKTFSIHSLESLVTQWQIKRWCQITKLLFLYVKLCTLPLDVVDWCLSLNEFCLVHYRSANMSQIKMHFHWLSKTRVRWANGHVSAKHKKINLHNTQIIETNFTTTPRSVSPVHICQDSIFGTDFICSIGLRYIILRLKDTFTETTFSLLMTFCCLSFT